MLHSCREWICICAAAAAAHICSDIIFWQIRFRQNNGLHHHQGGRRVQILCPILHATAAPKHNCSFEFLFVRQRCCCCEISFQKTLEWEREALSKSSCYKWCTQWPLEQSVFSCFIISLGPLISRVSSTHTSWPHIIFQDAAAKIFHRAWYSHHILTALHAKEEIRGCRKTFCFVCIFIQYFFFQI